MRKLLALALIAVLALSVTIIGAGTKDHPYKLILVPSTNLQAIPAIGDEIAAKLTEMTGLEIDADMTPTTEAAIADFSTAEQDVFGFLSTKAYLLAVEETYAVSGEYPDAALVSLRNGYAGYWSAFYVRRDSGLETIQDLDGKIWGFPYPTSTSGYAVPVVKMEREGITPVAAVDAGLGSHELGMVALYQGTVDFITGFWSPPKAPPTFRQMGIQWNEGDPLELGIWNDDPDIYWSEEAGRIEGPLAWYVKDLRETFLLGLEADLPLFPDVVDVIKPIALTDIIPNDGVQFVPGFPEEDKAKIVAAIEEIITTDFGKQTFGNPSFYAWDNVMRITDAFYNNYRAAKDYDIPPYDQ